MAFESKIELKMIFIRKNKVIIIEKGGLIQRVTTVFTASISERKNSLILCFVGDNEMKVEKALAL